MAEFKSALEQFLRGDLGYQALVKSLESFLQTQPDDAPDVTQQLDELFHAGRLPKQVYDLLVDIVRPGHSQTGELPQSSPATKTLAMTRFAPITEPRHVRAEIGATLKERFVLQEVLGRGGMGVVFKALDLRRQEARDSDPYVALKVLGDDIKDVPEAFVILQRESKKAQALAHPNIATVYDFDRDGSVVYMCMELLEGESLAHLIRRLSPNGLSLDDARPVIHGMSRGLARAHSSQILHADFKPGNVFLTQEGNVKILDFGIARAVSLPGQTAKETVFDAGKWEAMTPTYASCEMIDGLPPDPRDDVYGLACVTYELLSGRHPFDRKPANQARALDMKPPPISNLSRAQNAALARGLAFKRDDRSATAKEFASELLGQANAGGRLPLVIGSAATVTAVAILAAWIWWPKGDPALPGAPQPVLTVVPDAAKQQRIASLLLTADAHLSVGRLIEPRDSSAAAVFQAVLELDPDNAAAQEGLRTIAENLAAIARERLSVGDLAGAQQTVQQGLEAVPDSESLLELAREL